MSDIQQHINEMREQMKKLHQEESDTEARIQQAAKDRKEQLDRQNALNWLRTLLFPFIEETASARGLSIRDAAEKIVADGTRIDLLLREHWQNSEVREMLDSGPARMMITASAGLLNQPDEQTREGAKWLLDKVLPADPEGADIREAFLKNEPLWIDTIVGLKRLFASRQIRPHVGNVRNF